MRIVTLAAALMISGLAVSGASAAPVAPINGAAQHSPVIDVQYHRDRDRRDYRRYGPPPPRYRAGYRYKSPPRGYRRYDRRPGDWNRRGCVMVGPVWFCP